MANKGRMNKIKQQGCILVYDRRLSGTISTAGGVGGTGVTNVPLLFASQEKSG